MKKRTISPITIGICLPAILIIEWFLVTRATVNIKNIEIEDRDIYISNNKICSKYQTDMSNYVIEHHDEIFAFCNEVFHNYDDIISDDMEADLYRDMLDKHNLSYFYDYTDTERFPNISFDEDKILFRYDRINLDNAYAEFHFEFEDDRITISPYEYAVFQTGY